MNRISRRAALGHLAAVAVAATALGGRTSAQAKTRIVVYKDPGCGCCGKWIEHMTANGFAPTVTNMSNAEMAPLKALNKVPAALQSCHTSLVAGYVIEGHVPAADVKRLLTAKPRGVVGLTIPGMPASAPGMDLVPFQPYDVLSFDASGKTTLFARHDNS